MRHPWNCRAPTDPGHPLAENGSFDQRDTPEGIGHAGIASTEIADCLMRDKGNVARRDGADSEIENGKVQALQIWRVTSNMEADDLSFAFHHNLVAAGCARQQQTWVRRPVAFTNDGFIGPDNGEPAADRRFLIMWEWRCGFASSYYPGQCHALLPYCSVAGAVSLSVVGEPYWSIQRSGQSFT